MPHTATLAFVGGGEGGGTSSLHPDFLSAVAREARRSASAKGKDDGNGDDVGDAAASAAARFASRPLPAYWTIDFAGNDVVADAKSEGEKQQKQQQQQQLDDDLDEKSAVALYASIARLQTMDAVFYESQRQGRFSFYMTSAGEEATAVGSAAALHARDPVFAQYREQGVLLHRGFSFRDFADQCFGSELEPGKGRQMPIHYGSRELSFHTISSPLATQLPQAVGTAYALSREQAARGLRREERNVAVAYFGDGASSEGDFHAAANFAAVLAGSRGGTTCSSLSSSGLLDDDESAGGTPLLLICRNNGWCAKFFSVLIFSVLFSLISHTSFFPRTHTHTRVKKKKTFQGDLHPDLRTVRRRRHRLPRPGLRHSLRPRRRRRRSRRLASDQKGP